MNLVYGIAALVTAALFAQAASKRFAAGGIMITRAQTDQEHHSGETCFVVGTLQLVATVASAAAAGAFIFAFLNP